MTMTNWRKMLVLSIAGLIALMPILFILDWAIAPIWSSISQAEDDTALVGHLEMLVAEKPGYRAALAKANARLTSEGAFFGGSSAELASAQLQNSVQGLVAEVGGQIESSAIGVPQTSHGLQILTVSLSFSLAPNRLPGFLTSIDAQKPYLIIQSIDLRSTDDGNGIEPLDVQLQVNGFSDIQ
jgi:hypothetical protein